MTIDEALKEAERAPALRIGREVVLVQLHRKLQSLPHWQTKDGVTVWAGDHVVLPNGCAGEVNCQGFTGRESGFVPVQGCYSTMEAMQADQKPPKTPGQIAYEEFAGGYGPAWQSLKHCDLWERVAQAVLDAQKERS